MENNDKFGIVDLGIEDNVRQPKPINEKPIEEWNEEDYIRLMNGEDSKNNQVFDLDSINY